MKRRGFLGRLAALFAAPFVPVPKAPQALAFHPDAFALAMEPLTEFPTRYDVLFGYGALNPEYAIRVMDYDKPQPGGYLRYLEAERKFLAGEQEPSK